MAVHVAINQGWVNKEPPFEDPDQARAWWRVFNGGFRNREVGLDEWIGEIRQGHAFCPWVKGYRKADNFLEGNHVALDLDTADQRSSIPYLAADPFIGENATFIYSTPSSTPERPKSRVVFVLDRPIKNREKYALLTRSLVYRYGQLDDVADRKCKDPVRLFYGARNCEVELLNNRLVLEVAAEELVQPFNEYLEAKRAEAEARAREFRVVGAADVSDGWLRLRLETMLNKVRWAADGDKHEILHNQARAFGGYVAAGYLSRSDAVALLQEAIQSNPNNVKSLAHAYSLIEEKVDYGMRDPLYFTTRIPQPAQPARTSSVASYMPSVKEALETLGRPLTGYKMSGGNWIDTDTGETGDVVDLFGMEEFGEKWDRTDGAMVQVILKRFEEAAGIGSTRAALPRAAVNSSKQDWGQAHSSYFRS